MALGSGGARGYAHIGVIQVLEERGYEIAGIAGSSMGALVGGVWAVGKLEEFERWARSLTPAEVFKLLDVSFGAPGAMRAEKVIAHVQELVGDELIENLPVPFTAVATDLISRREVWLQRGRIDLAIRASIALPGILTPVMLNGRLLADGGLMDPVPVTPTAALDVDLRIGVSVGGERQDPAAAVVSTGSEAAPEGQGGEFPARLRGFDVMSYAIAAMQTLVNRYRLAGSPPDVLVTIPATDVRTLEFHRADLMIDLGRTAAARALEEAGIGRSSA